MREGKREGKWRGGQIKRKDEKESGRSRVHVMKGIEYCIERMHRWN